MNKLTAKVKALDTKMLKFEERWQNAIKSGANEKDKEMQYMIYLCGWEDAIRETAKNNEDKKCTK